MSKTHWKKLRNPKYLGAHDLDPGQEIVATIRKVVRELVVGEDGKKEECTVVQFENGVKPLIVNVTNAKTIAKLHGTPYIEDWAGKTIQLYAAKVKAFGELTDAIRIRDFLPKSAPADEALICADCSNPIAALGEKSARQIAGYTKQKYGAPLCADCASTRAAVVQPEEEETAE